MVANLRLTNTNQITASKPKNWQKLEAMKNTPKSIFLQIGEDVDVTEQLVCECEPHSYYEWEKEENKCDKCGKPLVKITSIKNKPITPEMLEAYGFEKNDMGEGEAYYSLRLSDERYCDLAFITGEKNGCMEVCLFPYEDFFRVRYEHEMLAMYKGITGKDLVANFA